MRFKELADRPYHSSQPPTLLQITPRSQGIPQLYRELRDQIRSAPHRALGARSKRVESQRVPAVEGRDAIVHPEEQFREIGRVARGILEILHADLGQRGDLLRGKCEAAGGGDVVVHDGQI